jgi:antitoxin component of MazEF toxin-antitoxin module
MLQKKLTKVGNSYALILDKPLMDLAGISANEPVVVYSTGHGLVVTAAPQGRDVAFKAAKEHVFKRHGEVLKRLAK